MLTALALYLRNLGQLVLYLLLQVNQQSRSALYLVRLYADLSPYRKALFHNFESFFKTRLLYVQFAQFL